MIRNELEAMFLLAGIEVLSAKRLKNCYWPDHDRYEQYHRASPWWLVKTEYGDIVIGWRKKVIHIDWARTGVVFPLINPQGDDFVQYRHVIHGDNVTKWQTGCHAWGYGPAVQTLRALKDIMPTAKYVQKHWGEHPTAEADKKEWLVIASRYKWLEPGEDNLEVTISEANQSFALEIFHKQNPDYSVVLIGLKDEILEVRKQFKFDELEPTKEGEA